MKIKKKLNTNRTMEEFDENLIWDKILNSAKNKFDYETFKSYFDEIDQSWAEDILFKVIDGFASEETKEFISAKLFSEMLLLGFMWDKNEIDLFLNDKDKVLSIEIFATQHAGSMLEDGNNVNSIIISLDKLLRP